MRLNPCAQQPEPQLDRALQRIQPLEGKWEAPLRFLEYRNIDSSPVSCRAKEARYSCSRLEGHRSCAQPANFSL